MPDMTEEEYDALDELWTKNPPKVSGNGKSGFFMQHKNEIVILDDVSATWLRLKSETTNKSTSEIIGELVRKELSSNLQINASPDVSSVDTAPALSPR
jgi:predicted CopG family antitoxin